ncbi:MAG: cytochrome c [Verrucomicrobia bacterium]|nr:cytochrome c [Verrucomicrobiota bacterium]
MKLILTGALLVAAATWAGAASDGAAIYKAKCAKCHGEKGEGSAKATEKLCKGVTLEQLKLDPIAAKSDDEVRKFVVDGKDKMPAYKEKLTAEEIDAVVAFCRQLVPAKK